MCTPTATPAPPAVGSSCRHCNGSKVNRPRGLCWTCYYTPGVRDRYPPTSKSGTRGVRNFNGPAPLPEPTDAPPGSAAKVAVLEQRARLGQALWHPRDAAMDPESAALFWRRLVRGDLATP